VSPPAADPGRDAARAAEVERLWEELSGSLRARFRGVVSSPEDAEDLLQECFLRVHAGLDGVRDEERLGAWIRRIAERVLIDAWRARSAHPLEEEPAAPAPTPPEETNLDAVVAGWLRGMVEALDEPHRTALVLAELEGRPRREIAERLGLSLTAAKSRVQRAREKLRERLQACCELEFDRRGGVVDWRRRGGPPCCQNG